MVQMEWYKPVNYKSSSSSNVVDGILKELNAAGCLDNNVKPVRVVLFDRLPLSSCYGSQGTDISS